MEDNMTVTDGEEFTISTLTETEDSKFCIDEEEFQFAWHFNKNSSSWYVLSIYLHILNWFKDSFFLPDSIIDYVPLAHAVTLIVEDANTKLGVAYIACGVAKNIDDNYKSLEPLEDSWRPHLEFNDHEHDQLLNEIIINIFSLQYLIESLHSSSLMYHVFLHTMVTLSWFKGTDKH